MRTSLLNDIESWATKFSFSTGEIRSTNYFIVVQINNYSVNSIEIKALERTIKQWFKDAHWHSIDHVSDGLEIWIAI